MRDIDRRQGLIKQKRRRIACSRAAHGHPLTFSAGQLVGPSIQQVTKTKVFNHLPDPVLPNGSLRSTPPSPTEQRHG
jgi:hypothetical protein